MGLFDGRLGSDGWASTAHVATLTASPVVLVVDISSAARTVAATVHGLRTFDPAVRVAGVVLNKSGSPRHAEEVRRSVEATGLPVLGVLPRDAGVTAPSRHLGLVPAAERPEAQSALDLLAEQTERFVDLDALLDVARSAPDVDAEPWTPPTRPDRSRARGRGRRWPRLHLPVCRDRRAAARPRLRAGGLRPGRRHPAARRHRRPLSRWRLPRGVCRVAGDEPAPPGRGARGRRVRRADRRRVRRTAVPQRGGRRSRARRRGPGARGHAPTAHAALPHRLDDRADASPARRGRRCAATSSTGRELAPGHGPTPAWLLDGEPEGFSLAPAGRPTVHASYLHTHWAGHPELAEHFADAVHDLAPSVALRPPVDLHDDPARDQPTDGPNQDVDLHRDVDLDHHGDVEVDASLVDFAVNVRLARATGLARHVPEVRGPRPRGIPQDRGRARRARPASRCPGGDGPADQRGAEAFVLLAEALQPNARRRGAPPVHRARGSAATRRASREPPCPRRDDRLHPRRAAGRPHRRPRRGRQPHEPHRRPAPAPVARGPAQRPTGWSSSTRRSWTPCPASPRRSSVTT